MYTGCFHLLIPSIFSFTEGREESENSSWTRSVFGDGKKRTKLDQLFNFTETYIIFTPFLAFFPATVTTRAKNDYPQRQTNKVLEDDITLTKHFGNFAVCT